MQMKHYHSRSKAFRRWFIPLVHEARDERRETRTVIPEKRQTSDEAQADRSVLPSALRFLPSVLWFLLSAFCFLPSLRGASLWSNSVTPAITDSACSASQELGVRFFSDTPGQVTGIRFYKGTGNTGTHVGHLWDSSGHLLASVTFANESASGWQQQNLATPITISAKTTYTVSYWDPNCNNAVNVNYFTSQYDAAPLHALANGTGSPNGVYNYGASGFPTSTYGASNYWVDVVFAPAPAASAAVKGSSLFSASATPGTPDYPASTPYELGVKFFSDVAGSITAIRFYKGVNNTGTHVGHLWSSNGTLLSTATFTSETASGWQQVSLPTPVQIQAGAVYTASYWDPNGNNASDQNYFTSQFNNAPLHAVAGANGVYNYNASAFPTSSFGSTNYWVDVVFVPNSNVSLFGSATPNTPDYPASVPYELGVKFYSDVAGTISGLRFYKGVNNSGTHVGHLWTSSGTLLVSATFTNETASGWQQVNFAQPVSISANTVYVASYWDPNGNNASDQNYFASQYNHAPLHAVAGSNGVYNYAASGFPTGSYASTNYWVDVVFTPGSSALPSSSRVTISSVSPASGPVSGGTLVTINGSGFESGSSISFAGAQATSVSFISSTQLQAVTPSGAAGAVNVTVTTPDPGSATLSNGFMYVSNPTVTSVSPSSGPTTGGTTVTINGTSFQSGAMVAFGAVLAASVTVMSPTQIQAITPAEAAGTVSITVTNPDAGKASLASVFSFLAAVPPPPPPPSGALLTGMTVSNYTVPSGWTAADVNGFENSANNGLNNGESFYGGGNKESQNCSFAHSGSCSIDTYVTASYQGLGIVLSGNVINNRETYVSFWQYTAWNNSGTGALYGDWYITDRVDSVSRDSLDPDWNVPGGTGCVWGCNPGSITFFQNNPTTSTGPAPWAIYGGYWNEDLNQWVQYEVHLKVNDPGTDNGRMDIYQNGQLMLSVYKGAPGINTSRCPVFNGQNDCGYFVGDQDFTKANLYIPGDWGALTDSGSSQVLGTTCKYGGGYTAAQECPPSGVIPYFHIYIDDVIVLTRNGVQ